MNTSSIVPSPRDGELPRTFPAPVWAGFARSLLHDWLGSQFRWRHTSLASMIAAVSVTIGDRRPLLVWTSRPSSPSPLPAPGAPSAWTLGDTVFDLWHPAWQELVEHWHLDGPWLHPETRFQIDQMCFAENLSSLLIGCPDRADPRAPRRYDPSLLPDTNDIGVIAFPLFPHRALDHLQIGYDPETAMLLCAGTAVVEAAVHEALELFQEQRGVPVLDPHSTELGVAVSVVWRAAASPGVVITVGSAT